MREVDYFFWGLRLPSILVCDGNLLRSFQSRSQEKCQIFVTFAEFKGERFVECAPILVYQGTNTPRILGSGFAYSHVENDRFAYLCLNVRVDGGRRVDVGHIDRARGFVKDVHWKFSVEEKILACSIVEGVCVVLVSSIRILVFHQALAWEVKSFPHDRTVHALLACEVSNDNGCLHILTLATEEEQKTRVFSSWVLSLEDAQPELKKLPYNLWRIPSAFAAETQCVHRVSELALPDSSYGQYVLVGTSEKTLVEVHEGRVVATCDLPAVPVRLLVTPQQLGVSLLCILFNDATFHIYGFTPGVGSRQPLRAFQHVGWFFFDDFLHESNKVYAHHLLLCTTKFSKLIEWDGKRGVHLTDLSSACDEKEKSQPLLASTSIDSAQVATSKRKEEEKTTVAKPLMQLKSNKKEEESKKGSPATTMPYLFSFARSLQLRAELGLKECGELEQEQRQRRALLQRGMDLLRFPHRPWRSPWARDLVGVTTGERLELISEEDERRLAQEGETALSLDGLRVSWSPHSWNITCYLTNSSAKPLQQLSLALRCAAGVHTTASSQWCGSLLPGEGAALALVVDPSSWPANHFSLAFDVSAQVHEERKGAEGFEWGFDESAAALELGRLELPRWPQPATLEHVFNHSNRRYTTHNHLRSEVLVYVPLPPLLLNGTPSALSPSSLPQSSTSTAAHASSSLLAATQNNATSPPLLAPSTATSPPLAPLPPAFPPLSLPPLSALPQLLPASCQTADGTVPLIGGANVNFNFALISQDRAGLTLWADDSDIVARTLHSFPRLLGRGVQLTPWVDPQQVARFLRSLAKEAQLVQGWLQEQTSEPHTAHFLFLQQQFRALQAHTDLLAAGLWDLI